MRIIELRLLLLLLLESELPELELEPEDFELDELLDCDEPELDELLLLSSGIFPFICFEAARLRQTARPMGATAARFKSGQERNHNELLLELWPDELLLLELSLATVELELLTLLALLSVESLELDSCAAVLLDESEDADDGELELWEEGELELLLLELLLLSMLPHLESKWTFQSSRCER